MSYEILEQKLKMLPEQAIEEVSLYIDYIFFRLSAMGPDKTKSSKNKKIGFGCLKDISCKMSPDFDKPLDDFEEYM